MQPQTIARESLDGAGSADHDQSYRFGRHPNTRAPFPFTERQFARLLVLRGRVHDGAFRYDNEIVLRDVVPATVTELAL